MSTTVPARLDRSLRTLAPGYFALVMATGIVAIGLAEAGAPRAATAFLVIGGFSYLVLAALFVARWVRHRDLVRRDQENPETAFGYFTVVAATAVLAVGFLGTPAAPASVPLLAVALIVWVLLGYLLPWRAVMTRNREGGPTLSRINGTWFVWSVASQSLALGLAASEASMSRFSTLVGILAVLSWSVGSMLYVGIAGLVVLRIIHFGITPEEADPSYWVAMGALAISVVAGAGIVEMSSTPMVDAATVFIGGTVVVFWCFAAWLVPWLVGAGVWRHVVNRVPLRYTPSLWSMVFPLGMFAVASMRLGAIDDIVVMEGVGLVFLGVAILAWVLVTLGFVKGIVRGRREGTSA